MSFLDRLSVGARNFVGRLFGELEVLGLDDILPPPKWYVAQVDRRLFRGAEPEGARWQELAHKGIRAVVSLQAEEPAETAAAARLGMRALRIPLIDNTTPNLAEVKAFLDFVSQPQNQPAYVHCRAGKGRTGVMVAAYRMALCGWPVAQAVAEAKAYGMAIPAQEAFIRRLAVDLSAGRVAGYPRAGTVRLTPPV